ncbi:MAG: hypothetical protein NTY77_16050 [Elusimicrobia bacterium]|nr:hypothetical protein [Elusimicrobiota bacterium]
MMKVAQGQAVGDDGLASGVAVRKDVGGVEELLVAQSADGALFLIGFEDALAEGSLVDALLDFGGDVVAAQGDLARGGGVVGPS